jgi:general secretion pathway protein L
LLNLLPGAQGSALSPLRYGANPWLAGLVAILVLATLAMPLVIKREAVVQLLPAVDKGKKAAAVVTTVRDELDKRVAQHNFLLEKRQMTPPVIQMLEELTHILPDDTWVSVFDLKGKVLTIEGETSTATSTKLIGLFEHSSIFSDASLGSALFKGQAADTSRYKLAIKLRPPVNVASTPAPPALAASAVSAASVASAVAAVLAVSKPSAPTASQPVAGKTP